MEVMSNCVSVCLISECLMFYVVAEKAYCLKIQYCTLFSVPN